MGHDGNGLRILGREECMALLAAGGLGRIGMSQRALPVILPVSFGLLDDAVVFPVAGDGSLLRAATRSDVVCFEADSADIETGRAWSVMVTGQLARADDPETRLRAAGVALRSWLPRELSDFALLPMTMIAGRHSSTLPDL